MEIRQVAERAFVVHAHWDAEARRWWAESDDIPGLVTEADTFEDLVDNVLALAPELLELNAIELPEGELPIQLMAERMERVRARS